MKSNIRRAIAAITIASASWFAPVVQAEEPAPIADPGWPREHVLENKKLTVYQPQVDEWKDNKTMHFRCAIELEGVLKEPTFGVAEFEARTLVDQEARVVKIFSTKREYRFTGVAAEDEKKLLQAMDLISPPERLITVSLDRVITCLDADTAAIQKQVDVNLAPPKIFYSEKPAVLVIFLGEPQFKPVVAEKPDLMFALNTNWDVFYYAPTKSFYLLNENHWLTGTSPAGPWSVATKLPESLSKLPDDENWAEIRKQIPPKPAEIAELVYVSKEPAELLLTAGKPEYNPIPDTKLLEVTNSESLLLVDSAGGKFYYQAAGRWFRAPSLEGPWEAASADLPEDFAKIPDEHPLSFVKATVPGTDEAMDAVLLASVPQSTFVDSTKEPTLEVTYKGEPNFQPIPSTTVKYAVNSPSSVFLVDNGYYCCDQGVWFSAKTATGPWQWSTSVPDAIYTIPTSSPAHNVTYVTVEDSSDDTIVYQQTAGYSGEYVAGTGVLMFGAGLLTAAILNDWNDHYCYPSAAWYSYGCGAVYNYGYGGYYGAAGRVYGPYGGAGYGAAYNPITGTYARGGYVYGPNGAAGYRAAYNPYTGGYAARGYRATPYGTATAGRAYNPYTGARAAGGRVSTAYGSAGRAAAYNPITGKGAVAGGVSGSRGSVAGIRTSEGTGAAAWDTRNGQGAVAKTKNDSVLAAHNGNVYRKDSDGNWQSNASGSWKPVESSRPGGGDRPAPTARQPERNDTSARQTQRPSAQPTRPSRPSTQPSREISRPQSYDRQSLDRMSQTRSRGNSQAQRSQSFQSSRGGGGARSGGGASRGGGGGGGRRR